MKRLGIYGLALALIAAGGLGGMVLAEGAPELLHGFRVVEVVVLGETLDVPGLLVDGRTYIPLRPVTEGLGYGIRWNAETMTASVVTLEELEELGETGENGTFGATSILTAEEALEVFLATVSAAKEAYSQAETAAGIMYQGAGYADLCDHKAARVAASEAAYIEYSMPGHPGAFLNENYDLYLAACAEAKAIQEAACAAASCPDPVQLYDQAVAAAAAIRDQAIAEARADYDAALAALED